MRRFMTVFALAAATAVSIQAQTNGGDPPQYDAKFVLTDGQVYSGTTTFVVDAKGTVTGKMVLTVPTPVNSTLAGSLKENVWTFKYTYVAPVQECSGAVTGTGTVSPDRKLISGNAMITGCSDTGLAAVFTFTKRDKN